MPSTPTPINQAYTTRAEDYKGSLYRRNTIDRSINERLSALESGSGQAPAATASGQSGQAGNSGYVADTIVANAITPDLGAAFSHEVTLDQAAQITINDPIYTGGSILPGQDLWIIVVQDATGGRPQPAWGANFAGVGADTTISPDPGTYSALQFKVRIDGKFALLYISKGLLV